MNFQRSRELDFQKLSKTAQNISKGVSNISNEDLIEYLKQESTKQEKRDNRNLIISIINTVAAVGAFIIGIINFFR